MKHFKNLILHLKYLKFNILEERLSYGEEVINTDGEGTGVVEQRD